MADLVYKAEAFQKELAKVKHDRKRLLDMHHDLLGQAKAAMGRYHAPSHDAETIPESVLRELEAAREQVLRLQVQVADLQQLELTYRELKLEYGMLEETNQRLIAQLLEMDSNLKEVEELQQIVDLQKASLTKSAQRIRELEERIHLQKHNLEILTRENNLLRERIESARSQLQPLLKAQIGHSDEMKRMRAQVRQKELALLQVNEAYEALRLEYEALYNNLPRR